MVLRLRIIWFCLRGVSSLFWFRLLNLLFNFFSRYIYHLLIHIMFSTFLVSKFGFIISWLVKCLYRNFAAKVPIWRWLAFLCLYTLMFRLIFQLSKCDFLAAIWFLQAPVLISTKRLYFLRLEGPTYIDFFVLERILLHFFESWAQSLFFLLWTISHSLARHTRRCLRFCLDSLAIFRSRSCYRRLLKRYGYSLAGWLFLRISAFLVRLKLNWYFALGLGRPAEAWTISGWFGLHSGWNLESSHTRFDSNGATFYLLCVFAYILSGPKCMLLAVVRTLISLVPQIPSISVHFQRRRHRHAELIALAQPIKVTEHRRLARTFL